MESLECTVCKYRTPIRCNFNKHITTEKHKRNILNAPKLPVNAPKLPVNAQILAEIVTRNPLACVHCIACAQISERVWHAASNGT